MLGEGGNLMKNKWRVDFWIDAYALAFDAPFSVIHIAKDTGIPEDVVLNRLTSLLEDGKILTRWVMFCPKCTTRIAVTPQNEAPVYILDEKVLIKWDMSCPKCTSQTAFTIKDEALVYLSCEEGKNVLPITVREFTINPKYRQFVVDFAQFEGMKQFLV